MLIFATATFAIITASPLVWMVSASLKEPAKIFDSSLIPQVCVQLVLIDIGPGGDKTFERIKGLLSVPAPTDL
jgi:hypothetical protein